MKQGIKDFYVENVCLVVETLDGQKYRVKLELNPEKEREK